MIKFAAARQYVASWQTLRHIEAYADRFAADVQSAVTTKLGARQFGKKKDGQIDVQLFSLDVAINCLPYTLLYEMYVHLTTRNFGSRPCRHCTSIKLYVKLN